MRRACPHMPMLHTCWGHVQSHMHIDARPLCLASESQEVALQKPRLPLESLKEYGVIVGGTPFPSREFSLTSTQTT